MRYITILVLVGVTACRQGNPEENAISSPEPPPALALVPMRGAAELDNTLALLEKELNATLAGELDGEGEMGLLRAEAITDRLLETRLPFGWLRHRGYAVEPLLRQIQALADRIVAERRSGARDEVVRRDLLDLRRRVLDLRSALAKGGGPMPPSLDSLLAAYPADSGNVLLDAGGE